MFVFGATTDRKKLFKLCQIKKAHNIQHKGGKRGCNYYQKSSALAKSSEDNIFGNTMLHKVSKTK